MKIRLTAFVLLLTLSITSCETTEKKEEPQYTPIEHKAEMSKKVPGYYCPMECEGDKTYADSNKLCPVCDMKMVHTK